MPVADPQWDVDQGHPPLQCDECQSVLQSDSRQPISFLLLDQLTIPIIGCDDHLEQFTSICGLTTEDTADLLDHQPAGGICCPGCRLAPYNTAQPMISIQEGAVAVTACPDHQLEIVDRFYTGLQTQQHLTSNLNTNTGSSL